MEDRVLNIDELEKITGGQTKEQKMFITCPHCGRLVDINILASSMSCPKCNKPIDIKG